MKKILLTLLTFSFSLGLFAQVKKAQATPAKSNQQYYIYKSFTFTAFKFPDGTTRCFILEGEGYGKKHFLKENGKAVCFDNGPSGTPSSYLSLKGWEKLDFTGNVAYVWNFRKKVSREELEAEVKKHQYEMPVDEVIDFVNKNKDRLFQTYTWIKMVEIVDE